jgi:hypothetical protein
MNALDSEISRAEQKLLPGSNKFFSILVLIEMHWFDLKLLVCVFCVIMEHHFLERMANNYVIFME